MLTKDKLRPVWAEINLDHLKHNIREARRVVKKEALICAVIKADGYGHGATVIAKTLLENGADRLAVATLSEAIALRKAGYEVPLMVLGYTRETQGEELINYNIIQTIYSYEQAYAFSQLAVKKDKELVLHLKIDTGMGRLGFQVEEETVEEIKKIFQLPHIKVEGIFTHFAVADEADKAFTYHQFQKFMSLVDRLEKEGCFIPIKHVSNSAAIIDLPEMNLDMVRAGIMLYGLYPSTEVSKGAVQLKQVMTLKTRVAHVKVLPADRGVSYGLIYKTKGERKIITLPIGYADGFTRMLTNKAEVIVKGKKIPIVGKICMDQCMADATGVDISRDEEVSLFSSDPNSGNTIDDIAYKLGTINYEIVCMVGKRVPRVYVENNNFVYIKDNLLL
ncbi:alanine racemase [Clostridium formicaceticum]|uniref:Alanine racemase n=1 Tax=Clostridium formicaceticum TaxID=1497 RepID=A0AAC9WJ78_9CLOT|nr:alanine racemase [Clostridium formicaceticum]AOY74838.1 alanine racemase [Clostridium formicaceticum]ARE89235.1 Alanine racemase [Clostridium formicaceticum]